VHTTGYGESSGFHGERLFWGRRLDVRGASDLRIAPSSLGLTVTMQTPGKLVMLTPLCVDRGEGGEADFLGVKGASV